MTESDNYSEEGISRLAKHSNNFWFVYRNCIILDAIVRYVKKSKDNINILELGAGSGNICRFLKNKGYKIDASDMYKSALSHFEKEVGYCFVSNVNTDDVPCELKHKYDIVILGDVLEHLNDPVFALRNIRHFLSEAGVVLITVPALMSLWSAYDKYCKHKKRYTEKTLVAEMNQAGYKVISVSYFMFLPSFILFITRKLMSYFKRTKNEERWSRQMDINPLFDHAMRCILKIEYLLGRYVRYPFGSSLIAIGRNSKLDE